MKTAFVVITILLACAAIMTTVVIPVLALAADWKRGGKEDKH